MASLRHLLIGAFVGVSLLLAPFLPVGRDEFVDAFTKVMADLEGHLGCLDKVMADLGGHLGRLDKRLEKLEHTVREAADRQDKRMDRQDERMAALENSLGEVAEALVVPRVRRRIENCTYSTVAFLLIHRPNASPRQCSAVPVPADARLHLAGHPQHPASSTHFLTSARCFFDEFQGWQQVSTTSTLIAAGEGNVSHQCTLHSRLAYLSATAPLDLAVVVCSTPVPMPPTATSTRQFLMHEPVALAGFSEGERLGEYALVTARDSISGQTNNFAMHLHFTSLRSSMAVPRNASSAVLQGASSAASVGPMYETSSPSKEGSNMGYAGYKPEEGMSGGAVMDNSCGVMGIIERRSFWAPNGRFVRLTEHVLALLRGALCWGSGADAC